MWEVDRLGPSLRTRHEKFRELRDRGHCTPKKTRCFGIQLTYVDGCGRGFFWEKLQVDTVISTIVTPLGGESQTPFKDTYNEKFKKGVRVEPLCTHLRQGVRKCGYPPVTMRRPNSR